MKKYLDINIKELENVKTNLEKLKDKVFHLKLVKDQTIDDQILAKIGTNINLLTFAKGYLKILIENPFLIKNNSDHKNINLNKILDAGSLLKFYNQNSNDPTHNGLVDFDNLFVLSDKIIKQADDHIKELEQATQPQF